MAGKAFLRVGIIVLVLAAGAIAVFTLRLSRPASSAVSVIPAPAVDVQPSQAAPETAVFAGGCFWGVQGVFQHVKGVTGAVSGYAGGSERNARYELVSTGGTGHAESVQVTFEPSQISYGRLLQIYFSVAHDPTQLNRQGPDIGEQYRSAIFPMNGDQARIAKAYIAQLDDTRSFARAITTRIESFDRFYPAEAYHQDYLTRHPNNPYIVINDRPKVDDLKRLFPDLYRPNPILVGDSE